MELDTRQRAILAEMGIKVWAPPGAAAARSVPASPAPAASPASSAVASPAPGGAPPHAPSAVEGHTARSTPPAPADAPTEAAPPDVLRLPVATPQSLVRAAAQAAPAAPSAPLRQYVRPEGVDSLDWTGLQQAVASCEGCGLCESRQHTVFGVGVETPADAVPAVDWLIVGEAPGEQEDLSGEPFVGPAGQLLDNMLKACGRHRTQAGDNGLGVYIANVLKCRPPSNRNPQPEEVAACGAYLARQIECLQPRLIVAMGRFAAQFLLAETVPDAATAPLGKLRGQVYAYRGIPVVVTYHPAYLLRNLPDKAKAWADLCLAMAQQPSR